MTRVNISSHTVQVFGFMRLGRIPKRRRGTDAGPRSGTGTRICCQQPLQIMDRDCDIRLRPSSPEGCVQATASGRNETASYHLTVERLREDVRHESKGKRWLCD